MECGVFRLRDRNRAVRSNRTAASAITQQSRARSTRCHFMMNVCIYERRPTITIVITTADDCLRAVCLPYGCTICVYSVYECLCRLAGWNGRSFDCEHQRHESTQHWHQHLTIKQLKYGRTIIIRFVRQVYLHIQDVRNRFRCRGGYYHRNRR